MVSTSRSLRGRTRKRPRIRHAMPPPSVNQSALIPYWYAYWAVPIVEVAPIKEPIRNPPTRVEPAFLPPTAKSAAFRMYRIEYIPTRLNNKKMHMIAR
jgi:hypothetical protein